MCIPSSAYTTPNFAFTFRHVYNYIATFVEPPPSCRTFALGETHRSYKQQYSKIYFHRLLNLRQFVEESAARRWQSVKGGPTMVPRVLEVEKSNMCWIVGTVFLDMPMKPDVLEEIARDQSLPALPRPDKIFSPADATVLEDESGRIKLVGKILQKLNLVSGIIMAALGMETDGGEFEVFDACVAGYAPQEHDAPSKMQVDSDGEEWIGLISGLDIGETENPDYRGDLRNQLLTEYLAAETGSDVDQEQSSGISRLIIAGNSLIPIDPLRDEKENLSGVPEHQRQGYKPSETTAEHPLDLLASYLTDIVASIPVHVMPGAHDPVGVALPQQPLPRAMFGNLRTSPQLLTETNPLWLKIGDCWSVHSTHDLFGYILISTYAASLLGNSGQPLEDMCKYLPDPEIPDPNARGSSLRLQLALATLESRHFAPTAPDTIDCYPYQEIEPFILQQTPDLYFCGNQPRFETTLLEHNGIKCRIICIPKFSETGELVLFNVRTLDVKVVKFDAEGMDKQEMVDAEA
ncbi:hypothetical protein SISNIDRAFT_472204 [Sistotremastrum niveocremeum HHB9708]|uniref:DNA polymerase delta small subunit n=2 Tax=Sistotremastraceae TaxID=3402574 RepID=A0A165AMU4_9AGAM|nr:hypothetical protein SISNIDRAFT_472204 [Sistotremastrum niveocremeum HHB9708]KZT36966.1 hypothetical protein SISSUDRAFT_1109793 [Sistotremastrum suecicum HHB10207 ss-3]